MSASLLAAGTGFVRPDIDWHALAPELVLLATVVVCLVVDVFTGDSIPPHLLTAEAFALYQRHLRAGRGVIAVHITNRYLNLEPVLASHAKQLGLSMRVVRSVDRGGAPSVWGVLSAEPSLFDAPAFQSNEVSPAEPHLIAWTDEHHSLLPLLLAR